MSPQTFTRKEWMTRKALMSGVSIYIADEVVYSTALSHPEWDMDERRTWEEWEGISR